MVLALPTLDVLRRSFPDAYIGYVVDERPRDLIAAHPAVDRVHFVPTLGWRRATASPTHWARIGGEIRAFVRELRAERYDVALDLQANAKGGVLALASGAPVRVGFGRRFSREGNHLFSTHHVELEQWPIHLVDKFLAAAAYLGADPRAARFQVPEPGESRERVEGFLRELVPGPYVVMHPGSSHRRPDKRWVTERFGQVAQRTLADHGLRTVVCYGPSERALAESVVASSAGSAVLAAASASLLDLGALLRRSVLFVGTDSGPMHLAAAVGVPAVTLFGSGSPVLYGPHPSTSPAHRVLFKPVQGRRGGMAAITVEEVQRAIDDSLRARTAA